MFHLLPSAVKSSTLLVEQTTATVNLPSGVRPLAARTKEEPKTSKKEVEKKVKKISTDDADEVTALIESDPSKKDVHEYFKMKIDKINEL